MTIFEVNRITWVLFMIDCMLPMYQIGCLLFITMVGVIKNLTFRSVKYRITNVIVCVPLSKRMRTACIVDA